MLLAVDMNLIWMVVLVVLVILFFVYTHIRNKKEQAKYQEMTNSLEKGDKVLTSAGIIGKIVNIENKDMYKLVTIETGSGKNKGYITFDSQAIYTVLEKKNAKQVEKVEETKKEENAEVIEQTELPAQNAEVKENEENVEIKEEKPKKSNKQKKK